MAIVVITYSVDGLRDVTAVRPLLVTGAGHWLAFTTALGLVYAAHETTRGGEAVDL